MLRRSREAGDEYFGWIRRGVCHRSGRIVQRNTAGIAVIASSDDGVVVDDLRQASIAWAEIGIAVVLRLDRIRALSCKAGHAGGLASRAHRCRAAPGNR